MGSWGGAAQRTLPAVSALSTHTPGWLLCTCPTQGSNAESLRPGRYWPALAGHQLSKAHSRGTSYPRPIAGVLGHPGEEGWRGSPTCLYVLRTHSGWRGVRNASPASGSLTPRGKAGKVGGRGGAPHSSHVTREAPGSPGAHFSSLGPQPEVPNLGWHLPP